MSEDRREQHPFEEESGQSVVGNYVQRSAKVFVRGCKKFVTALAYLFCLSLLGSCLARFAYFFADICVRT